jgi:predicted TIM-barrel fold metal-dependent hydrolase
MIIDSHGHLHPSQADLEDWDFGSVSAALRGQQRVLHAYHRPTAVTASGETAPDAWRLLWDPARPYSWEGRTEVNFRVENGRFAWDKDGVTYLAPVRPATDPAHLIALMDAVGVDKAVLHASLPNNRYYGRVSRAYPGRFLPVGYLHYEDDVDVTLAALGAAVEDGMAGLYQNPLPGWGGFGDFDSSRFDPLWQEVQRRGLPIYTMGWVSAASDYVGLVNGVYTPHEGQASFVAADHDYVGMLPKLEAWIDRFPSIRRVLVHGLPPQVLLEGTRFRASDLLKRLVNDHDTLVEVLPLAQRNYLHPRTEEMIAFLYDTFGPAKLAWGSEFVKAAAPHTPEHYAELKGYFAAHCPYMSAQDVALIQGGNLERMFGLA